MYQGALGRKRKNKILKKKTKQKPYVHLKNLKPTNKLFLNSKKTLPLAWKQSGRQCATEVGQEDDRGLLKGWSLPTLKPAHKSSLYTGDFLPLWE